MRQESRCNSYDDMLYFLLFLLCPSFGFLFEPDYVHHYIYKAESDYIGTQNITTTVKFHINQLDIRDDYRLMALEIDSIVQFSKDGIFVDNPHNWDLTKRFHFRLQPHGIVSFVHYHPEDPEEAILLKKALASTLSANVKILNDKVWTYNSTDTDHLGKLQHEYHGRTVPDGIRLYRHHRSIDKVERNHEKTLHLDSKGTVHKVTAQDHIIIENRLPQRQKRIPSKGEYVIEDFSDGEIGPVHAKANVELRLTAKRRKNKPPILDEQRLLMDDLIFKKIPKKVNISAVLRNITKAFLCIHNYTDKSDANRTLCVNDLRSLLISVKTEQLIKFCDAIFERDCKSTDVLCRDERYLLVDILSRFDNPDTQKLIIKHFFKKYHGDEEAMRRIFIHISALKQPIKELVSWVSITCFGENRTNHGSKNLTRLTQRACLALGNLARTISLTNQTEGDELMQEITSWLHIQEVGVKYRYRRSAGEYNPAVEDSHILSKMALIHTLGNAGLQSSKPHILAYMEPNAKHSAWRRAAIEATRHFDCHESAAALLRVLYNDDIISVRQSALERYKQHPKRNNLSEKEENEILRKSYTYPVVARVRRGAFLDVLDEPLVDFLIALPEFHWKKEIGGAAVGASFGIDFLNRIHLRIAPIQGFFRIDVHDRLFAEAHIGIINFQTYILLIDVCYKGHIEYNLNLLKDYVFDATGNMMKEYDKLARTIVSPIVNSAKEIADIFEGATGRKGIFGEISESVRKIPTQMDKLVNASTEFVSKINLLNDLPVLRNAKQLANKIQSYSESVKSDAVEFYNRVSDAAMITLPYAEKEMVDSFNNIIEAQKKLSDYPRQSFAEIDESKLRMKMSMSRLIEAKTAIIETISADQGSLPEWLSVSENMNAFQENLKDLVPSVRRARQHFLGGDEFGLQGETEQALKDIEQSIIKLSQNLDDVSQTVYPFMKSLKVAMDDMKKLKIKYDSLQDITKTVKTDVQKVFGTKFHKKFPSQRRICDDNCGCGVWPAKTGSKYQNKPGIDISLFRNWDIVMPVNGMIYRGNKSDEIRIRPVVDDLREFEIFLGNIIIKTQINESGTFVKAGVPIASPAGRDGCKDEYFHLAMKKIKSANHIDPSSFVDNVDLKPEWKEECKDFTFKHIGVNDLGKLGEGFKELIKDFAKRALDWVKSHAIDIITKILPDSPILGKIGKIAKAFMAVINTASDLGNMFLDMADNDGAFSDFKSTMESLSTISKGLGDIGGSVGVLLTEVGLPKDITDGFATFSNVANSVGKGFNIAGDLGDIDLGQGDGLDIASDIIKDTGEIVGTIGNVLTDAGISNSFTDALGTIQSVTNGVGSVLNTIKDATSGSSFNGDFKDTVNTIASTVAEISGTTSHLLHDLGVSSDVTGIFDKIQKGADDVTGIVDTLADFGSVGKDDGSFLGGLKDVSTNIGALSGKLGSFLNDVGVSKENTKIFSQIQKDANGFSSLTSSLQTTIDSFDGGSGDFFKDATSIASGIADTSKSLNLFLSGVGVSGDVTNVLGQIETGAKTVAEVSHKTGSIVHDIGRMEGKSFDLESISKNIAGMAKSVESGVSEMSDLFTELGMSDDVLATIAQIKKTTAGISGLASSVEKTFGDIMNITKSGGIDNIMHGLSSVASDIQQGAASVEQITGISLQMPNKSISSVSSLLEETSFSGVDDIISKFKNVESVAQTITQSFKDSPLVSRSLDGGLLRKLNIGEMKVEDFLSSATDAAKEISSRLPELNKLVNIFSNTTNILPTKSLISASYETFQDIAKKYRIELNGDKMSMTSLLYSIPEKVCDNFEKGISKGYGHTCIPVENCMGLQCNLNIPFGMSLKILSFSILCNPQRGIISITLQDYRQELRLQDGRVNIPGKTIDINRESSAILSGIFEVTKNQTVRTSLSLKICSLSTHTCFPSVHLLDNLTFKLNITNSKENVLRRKRMEPLLPGNIMDSVKQLPMKDFISGLSGRNIDASSVVDTFNLAKEGIKDKLNMNSLTPKNTVTKEFFKTSDKRDLGDDPEKHLDLTIFKVGYTFGVGPIGIRLEFGAGGAIGLSIFCDVRSKSGTSIVTIAPWISGQVYGGVSIELLIASGGIKLIGYIMKTKFPFTTETKQSKSPIEIVQKLDVELIPLELKLCAWAKVFGGIVFEKCFWSWSCSPIKWNIFTKRKFGKTGTPPKFDKECQVKQLSGRHVTDTAFHLEAYAQDDGSDLKLSYAIGTYIGGTDVLNWQSFRGTSLVSPAKLINGVPLYWTVKAKNTEGLETVAKCSLQTYDNTNPDGRIEAAYPFTSHPSSLQADVIILDDSPLIDYNVKALGYSPGPYGSEVIPWDKLDLRSSGSNTNILSDLKNFSKGREGKLSAKALKKTVENNEISCATTCLKYGEKCVSIDFDAYTQTCNLHSVIEGPFASLHKMGAYRNYERIDIGFNGHVAYKNISLVHGTVYYVNILVTNTLGYKSILSTKGTIIDFTPPEPGNLGLKILDTLKADGCNAAITQRCKDVTWKENHRLIIDGVGSRTVFNGHRTAVEQKYTISNHYISANWDGFKDRESGIFGFTWAAGRKPCGTDIVKYNDPHATLSSPKFWTNTGVKNNLHLEDGKYYVTVQALNNVIFGGSLVTTVCHSTPLIIDTSPPIFHQVPDVMFDEDFDILAVYYNVSDDGSGINRIDFGLGKSKHDIEVRGYVRRNHMNRFDPYFVVENLDLKPGVPAWIRVRAVNNVDQFASGHAPQPIMVDKTPPIVGVVGDGNKLRRDLQYQHETNKICAQWAHFYDPESGIKQFIWGVGSIPEQDDIVKFRNFSHHTKMGCAEAILKHNKTYYSTVIAFNDALNSKKSNGSSDGVLIDITPPNPGFVNDGIDLTFDKNFTSESATVRACWDNFTDLESHIADYKVNIYVNKELKKSFNMEQEKIFEDHSFSLHHLDFVSVEIETKNGAELKSLKSSDGVLVDHTPPNVLLINDCLSGNGYQADDKHISLRWKFEDQESDVKEYRVVINRLEAGQKLKIWPENTDYHVHDMSSKGFERYNISLSLTSGYKYFAHITAINKADLSTTHESSGVVIDITPPTLIKVHIGEIKEEEELDENGYILHDSPSSMTISWKARDFESNLEKIFVAIGTESNIEEELPWFTIDGEKTSALIENLNMVPTSKSNKTYIVSVKVKNRAGLVSKILKSKPIYVQRENVPGIIFDGRNLWKDEDYQTDKTSIAMSFIGFESEACNIIGYNWAVGSKPYFTDILPYTEYGIIMRNKTVGHAQIHLKLFEAERYFVTVRAKTGHNCRESYIVSTSNGIKIDTRPPKISFIHKTKPTSLNTAIFQKSLDSIDLTWEVNDLSFIANQSVSLRKEPFSEDLWHSSDRVLTSLPAGSVQLETGQVLFLTINSTDSAGLSNSDISPPIMIDSTIPSIVDFKCTPVISVAMSLVKCSWLTLIENESKISNVQLAVGTHHLKYNIMNFTTIPKFRYTWIRDLKTILKDREISKVYITIKICNILGNFLRLEFPVDVDRTEPEGGDIYFVTSTKLGNLRKQECQQPESFAEIALQNFKDQETALDKIQVGLGTSPGITNIMDYTSEPYSNYTFLNGVVLPVGKMVYATVRVFNSVGLFKAVVSDPVAISPSPSLSVIDGYSPIYDEDFQHRTSEMSGNWIYSDLCRVVKAEWAIEDIEGNVVQNFTNIPGASTHFFNDELLLRNGKTYINLIRITDALQRTFLSRSDGIAVRIQPPDPGFVRDGLSDDLDYQASFSEISANWDKFGNDMRKDPTQTIVKYMVAIGNDRRYSNTRSNVHTFVDVGLNRTHTFTNLNLTEKTVTYYVSVKAISQTGSEQESTSDGVRVGFRNGITPGKIHYDRFQAMTDKINVFWSSFGSDLGIRQYYVAVGSSKPFINNETSNCSALGDAYARHFDVLLPKSCGLDTYVTIENLQLRHGSEYFITVIAKDESALCSVVSGDSLTIDTTPPLQRKLFIGSFQETSVIYVHDNTSLEVHWEDGLDNESGIKMYILTLYSKPQCTSVEETIIIRTEIKNETNYRIYQLNLQSDVPYFVRLKVVNRAGLSTIITSVPIYVDMTKPLLGDIKPGLDWTGSKPFQFSQSEIQAVLAVAKTKRVYECPRQQKFPFSAFSSISNFSSECTDISLEHLEIAIRHDDTLQKIIKGGVRSDSLDIKTGVYSYRVNPLPGQNMSTIIGLSSDLLHIPLHFTERINIDSNSSTSTATRSPNVYSIGIAIRGYPNARIREIVLWAMDRYEIHTRVLNFEKENSFVDIDFELESISDQGGHEVKWNVKYFIDQQELVQFTGLVFQKSWSMFLLTNNNDGFFPPITDVFHPFYGVSRFTNIQVPLDIDHDCQHGKSFFDGESHIKEIWAGISDSISRTDNIKPFQLVMEICQPCIEICPHLCDKNCSTEEQFQIIPIRITNLTLLSASVANEGVHNRMFDTSNGNSAFDSYESPAYFVNAIIINRAGLEVLVHSPAITIDTTAPEFVKMKCVDPDHSMTEPANYQKSLRSLGAFWECNEDVSQIIRYVISVGVSVNDTSVLNETNIGLNTTFRVDSLEGIIQNFTTYFIAVHAYNSAGLHSKEFCNVTIDLRAPDISKTDTAVLFKSPSIINAPPNITYLSSQNNIGVQWNPHTTDAEFYEWQIGSHDGEGDLLEKVKVGNSRSRSVAIVNGRMWLDNQKTNTTLAEFVLKTWDNKSIAEAKKNAFYNIEPGKCVHMGLFAVSRSHLSSQLPLDANCYIRPADHLVSFHSRKIHTVHLTNDRFVEDAHHNTMNSNLTIKLQGSKGDISFGVLTRNDTRMNYGSASGPNYKPYIVDPIITTSQTSRTLQRRILKFSDLSFFMSPNSEAVINRWIDFTLTVNKSDLMESTQPTLVIWNRAKEEWQMFDDHCKQDIEINHEQGTLKGKICINDPDHERIKRQTFQMVTLTEPRQYALVIIKKELQNSPPIIKKTEKTIHEDGFLHYNIEWEDSENDNITFNLIGGPFHGIANITENGTIDYQPNPNFFGKDTIHIGITETISEYSQELVNQFNLTFEILIENVNDGPSMFFGTSSNKTFDSKSQNKIDLIVEANNAEYFIGSFVAFDIDQNDSLTYQVYSNGSNNMLFDLQETDSPNPFLLDFLNNSTAPPTVVKSFDLYLKLNVLAYGYVEYGLLVYDSVKWYSKAVWFQIFVLQNPCVHGSCERINPNGPDCNDKIRSASFEKFKCICDKGYEGQFCGNEINECIPNPCPLMYDCLDKLAGYTCAISPAKLVAILICICIAFLLIIIVYRKKKQAKKRMKVSDFWQANQMAGPSRTFPAERIQQEPDTDEEDQPLPQKKPNQSGDEHLGEAINILEVTSMFASRSEKIHPPHHVGRIRNQDCKPETGSPKKPSIHSKDGGVPKVNI